MRLSSRNIMIFFCFSLFLTMVASLLISVHLANNLTREIQNRETELIFSAIESGPLAISRLHSANIAQQELSRLMNHPNLNNRGLSEASIQGGENFGFTFANWSSGETIPAQCRDEKVRSFSFPDSINPFQIKLVLDSCYSIHEKNAILASSSIAGLLVTMIATLMFLLSVTPVADSIRRAEKILTDNVRIDIEKIKFLPIRRLVDRALNTKDLEKRAALSDLAAQVAHDIRSPLSALNMVLAALDEVPDEKKNIIKEAVRRINNIANDLLGRSKENSNDSKFSNSGDPVPVNSLVASVVQEKQIVLKSFPKIRILPSLLENEVYARINSSALERTLSNLMNNAAESIDSEGEISVSVSRKSKCAVISIRDTGKGIPAQQLTLIGKKGYSYGKAQTESGNGLGLFFAKQTVESVGGRIQITSEVGTGTEVQIFLPELSKEPLLSS